MRMCLCSIGIGRAGGLDRFRAVTQSAQRGGARGINLSDIDTDISTDTGTDTGIDSGTYTNTSTTRAPHYGLSWTRNLPHLVRLLWQMSPVITERYRIIGQLCQIPETIIEVGACTDADTCTCTDICTCTGTCTSTNPYSDTRTHPCRGR